MTDRELMQQALDFIIETNRTSSFQLVPASRLNQVITALHKRLAQPEQPVECMCGICKLSPRQWQGLTDEEIDELALDEDGLPNSHIEFACAIESKLKEKNG